MNYQTLLSYIAQRVYENTNQEISGTDLKESLDEIVAQLGAEFQFGGVVAHNATLPVGFGDYNVVYIGIEAGTYTNFGGAVLDGETIHFLTYNGSWSDTDTGIPTSTAFATKAEKDADAVEGNIAKFDSNGNPVDGGVPADNIAQKDGYYSQLVSGAAENIVGRSSVPASFLFRTTGGSADVGTGAAQIKELGGSGLVWNQMYKNGNFANGFADWTASSGATGEVTDGVYHSVKTGSATYSGALSNSGISNVIVGHKYLFIYEAKGDAEGSFVFGGLGVVRFPVGTSFAVSAGIVEVPSGYSEASLGLRVHVDLDEIWIKSLNLIDLTQLFNGSVPEGYSVDDFKADFPLPYYAYNTGEILPFAAEWLKTTGVNQWDEEWELGSYSIISGEKLDTSSSYRSKNFIPVSPNTTYYWCQQGNTYKRICFYDANKNFISYTNGFANQTFVTPANCHYITIWQDGTTYNNNLQIALMWSGGEIPTTYHPYEEHLFNIPISTMTGKVDGEGESVTIFGADGIVKAGSVSDVLQVDADGYARKVVKRIGKVDLGSLEWAPSLTAGGLTNFYASGISAIIKKPASEDVAGGIICAIYEAQSRNAEWGSGNNMVIAVNNSGDIFVNNYSYSDAAAFKTAMSGVYLYYELATPVEYVLDTPIFMGYYANDWGTECWGNKVGGAFVPAIEATEPYTAPSNYNVQYALNAADMLTNLVRNYMSINANGADESSMKALAGALSTALGIAISWTWDEATRKYTFAVADNRTFKVVAVPASASATGTAGNIAYDSDYLYVCVATDTWKRVALSTW